MSDTFDNSVSMSYSVSKRSLAASTRSVTTPGADWTSAWISARSKLPKARKKAVIARPSAITTTAVASGRGMCRARRATAGSIATAMKNAMRIVKMADPAACETKLSAAMRTKAPMTPHVARHTERGSSETLTRDVASSGPLVPDAEIFMTFCFPRR